MNEEFPLSGGQNTAGVVRVGDTVRRPLSDGWEFQHALLRHLEVAGFPYSPRLLGIDEQQREILTYLDGVTMTGGEIPIREVGAMIGDFHTATAGFGIAAGGEVVCHHDIAPWNTIHLNGQLVGMIDFDGAAPCNRVDDLAYAAWTFLDVGSQTVKRTCHGLEELCFGYGHSDRSGISSAILRQQRRVLAWRQHLASTATDPHLRELSQDRTVLIGQQMDWVERHADLIDGID